MNFDINKEEFDSLATLLSLNKILVADKRFNDMQLRKEVIESIQICFISDCISSSEPEDKVSELVSTVMEGKQISNEQMRLRKFSEAYATSVLLAYLQSFNSDRPESNDGQPLFGYTELDKNINLSFISSFTDVDNSANSLLEAGLLCKVRDIDSKEYFENALYKEDLVLLNKILAVDIDDGYNIKMLNAIRENDDIATKIDNYMVNLKAFYTLLLEDSFGVDQFSGVFKDANTFIEISDSNNAVNITKSAGTLQKLASRINSELSTIKISNSRQFDYDEIYSSNKVVYFPYKTIEYVLGRESTLNLTRNVYKPSAYAKSWSSYSENYIFKNLRAIIERGVYKAYEQILLKEGKIQGGFASSSVTSKITDYSSYIVNINLSHLDDLDYYLAKLVDSLSCFYILSKFGYLAKRITSINLRFSVGTKFNCFSDDVLTSTKLFKDLISHNDNEVFAPPFNLTKDRKTSTNVNIATNILEFQYDVNPMLSQAEPLFGYVVQKANQRKGVASGWKKILLGRSYSGKELYASEDSDIKMQNNFTHNIIAGSRSGKGVMTMNILANGIASGKPIFYLDRKPDMASMLYQYSFGKQFIVNGGLINPADDVFQKFDEQSGPALDYFRTVSVPYLKAHPEILELFGVATPSYQGILGDYIYLRAALFCLGICVIRGDSFNKNDTVFKAMNSTNGIIIIFDELTGFQNNIAQLLSTISSNFVQKALAIGDLDEIKQRIANLEGKIKVAQAKLEEATKSSAQIKAEEEIRALNSEIENMVNVQSLYSGTFFAKIKDSYNLLVSKKNAGWKQSEFRFSDIFVLGQNLTTNYYASSLTATNKGAISPVFFPLKADKKDYYSTYKGADIIRSFLEELGELDWFLGRNLDYDYGEKSSNTQAKKVCDEDGNWDYVGRHSCDEIRGKDYSSFSHTFFRPYLVLNTNDEANPPISGIEKVPEISESGVKSYTYVGQCADRTNKSAGGLDLWESVRVKHLKKEALKTYSQDNKNYDCLEEGIGFKGLVKETLLTTSSGREKLGDNIDTYIANSLAKSGNIADFVAKKMGYNCWQELIFDFSPQGIFSLEDMRNAVLEPSKYTMESRLPLYATLGALDTNSIAISESESPDSEPISYEDFDGGYEEEDEPQIFNEQPITQNSPQRTESTFERYRREREEARVKEKAEESQRLTDESLRNIIRLMLPLIPGFNEFNETEKNEIADEVFQYFREMGV